MRKNIKLYNLGLIIGIIILTLNEISLSKDINDKNLNEQVYPQISEENSTLEEDKIVINKIGTINSDNVDIKTKNIDKTSIKSYYKDIEILNNMKLHYAHSIYYKNGNEYNDLGEIMLLFIGENNKGIRISFSGNRDLLLDNFYIKGERIESQIKNIPVLIIDNTIGGYVASFNKDRLNYYVDAKGFSTHELVDLVKNIFESNISEIIKIVNNWDKI